MNRFLLLSGLKSPSTPRVRRFRQILIALLIYTLVGFFLAPAILKWQLVKRLPGYTHRQAAVQKVKVNPYALSLTIRGLSLTETNGEPFAGFDELYVNFQLSSLFRWAWTFSHINLTHPTASIVRDANGQLNFANLFADTTNAPVPPPAATNQAKSLPAVLVRHLVVTNGHLTVTDQTRAAPFRAEYGPTDLDIKDFTTRPNRHEPYSFIATTRDGESFAWSGRISVNPPRSSGEFKLLGIPLRKYSPYLAEFARFQVADGVLDISAAYRFDAGTRPLELEVTNLTVKLAKLQVETPEPRETLLALDDFALTGASASLAAREARVPRIAVRGGSLLARRNSDGKLNWLALLVTRTNETLKAAPDTNESRATPAAWKVLLDELDVENFNVTAEDRTTPTPAQLGLDKLRLNLKGVSNQSNAPVTAAIAFNWRGGGALNVEANGTLLPPAGEAKLALTNLALPPIQPYVEQQARLVLNAGELTVNGQARYSPGEARRIGFSGDVAIARFAAMDTVAYHDFAKWDNLSLRGLEVSLQTNSLNVQEIRFTRLETSLVVSSNGQLNVLALSRKKTDAVPGGERTNAAAPAPVAGADSFPIRIGALVFEKSSFHAADQSLTPRFNTSIEEFDGTIRDLTLPGLTRAGVDIHGKVSAVAPFEIVGAILPDAKNPFVDLKLAFTNSDLTPFDPYSTKYVGRPLNKGKLTFDLRYNIEDRRVKAANVLTLDQLTFGARNQSTNATKLPVKLAVALLKDREGRIDLDLPVSGSLDDPEFRIGALVWKAIVNILVKVATSPFSLLGAMFGGGGEELQFVDFAPGSATLAEAQTNKLDKLSKALYERPALSLEITASADPVADREALSLQKLRDRMKSLRIQELTARGKPVPAEFKLEEGDYEDLLRRTYKEEFNTTPERALREARAAAAATNAAAGAATNQLASATARMDSTRGASQLLQNRPGAPTEPSAPTVAAPTPGAPPAKPKTEAELVRDELEQRLKAKSEATDEELGELMQHRAEAVQKFLLDTGRVTADRLFLVAPKPVDPTVKGEARATFSLD